VGGEDTAGVGRSGQDTLGVGRGAQSVSGAGPSAEAEDEFIGLGAGQDS
jgi:hypothetical protein